MEKNFKCILIDDDIDEHEFFEIIVKKISLAVECVFTRSCVEAITVAENSPETEFNFIIVDWMLLDKTGLGCTRDLNQVSVFDKSKFIIYSIIPPPKGILESYATDNRYFIRKDHSFESVAEELKSLIAS